MNTPFGSRAELQGFPWKDISDEFGKDGITIKIHDGLMEVGYENESDEQKARRIAQLYVNSQSLRIGRKLKANFNHSWKRNPAGGISRNMEFSDNVIVSDRVKIELTCQYNIMGKASIVTQEMHDSASFTNATPIVDKALNNPVLEKSLEYFAQEVIEDDRPLYGVYKALEVITDQFGKDGRKRLGLLAGKNEKYVSEVMRTANTKRHAVTVLIRRLLDDNECIERAKVLIEAYARSL